MIFLTPEYLEWFKSTLGERVSINPTGGHLGNLIQPQVLKGIQESLSRITQVKVRRG